MAVKIRLSRVGTKKRPTYRIIATDSRSPRDGKNLEILGHYNPMVNPHELKVSLDRVEHWLKNGATASNTVKGLLKRARQAGAAPIAAEA